MEQTQSRPLAAKSARVQRHSPCLHTSRTSQPSRRSRKSLWRAQHRSKLPDPHQFPSEADKKFTDRLWAEVRARQPTSSLTQSTSSSSTNSSSMGKPTSRGVGVTDKDFRTFILERYGIQFVTKFALTSPCDHFGTETPEADPGLDEFQTKISEWYQSKHGHKDCHVWLGMNKKEAQRVAEQYVRMAGIRENEAKYSHLGKMFFFHADDLLDTTAGNEDRLKTTYFMLEWGPSPDGKLLRCPPQIQGPETTYSFKTKPDCTYWLTLARMNPAYRGNVAKLTFTLPYAKAVAPYLTIEFKKDSQKIDTAENQVAVSAALILYNRVGLRRQSLEARGISPETWSNDLFADIKHYGITFNGGTVDLHKVTPTIDCSQIQEDTSQVWRGCRLENFRSIQIYSKLEVLEVQAWINEIHNWGLGQHSKAFVMDIKGILTQGQRGSSRVSMSSEEMNELGLRDA